MAAIARLQAGKVSDDELLQARHVHLVAYAEYATQQPALAAQMSGANRSMYEPVTAEDALTNCCGHLLTSIGLAALDPERASRIAEAPAPTITFNMPDSV